MIEGSRPYIVVDWYSHVFIFLGSRLAADHLVCRFMLQGALAGFCLAVLPSTEPIGIIARKSPNVTTRFVLLVFSVHTYCKISKCREFPGWIPYCFRQRKHEAGLVPLRM
jgi:hypothetical protein